MKYKFNLQLFSDEEATQEAVEEVQDDSLNEALDAFNDDIDTPVEEPQDTPVEEEVEEPTEEPEETKEESEEPTEEKFLLKHFDGDKEVTKEEYQAYAQKGLDYDRIKTQRDEARNDPRLSTADRLEQLSKLYEYDDIGKFLDDLFGSYDRQKAESEGTTAENIKRERMNAEREQELDSKQKALEEETRIQEENSRFLDKYPNVKSEDIPQEVWKEVGNGTDLLTAYERHVNASEKSELAKKLEAMEKEMAILKKNAENDNRVKTGSLEGATDTKGAQEAYLAVWDED